MRRRGFLKALLGAPVLPVVAKVLPKEDPIRALCEKEGVESVEDYLSEEDIVDSCMATFTPRSWDN